LLKWSFLFYIGPWTVLSVSPSSFLSFTTSSLLYLALPNPFFCICLPLFFSYLCTTSFLFEPFSELLLLSLKFPLFSLWISLPLHTFLFTFLQILFLDSVCSLPWRVILLLLNRFCCCRQILLSLAILAITLIYDQWTYRGTVLTLGLLSLFAHPFVGGRLLTVLSQSPASHL